MNRNDSKTQEKKRTQASLSISPDAQSQSPPSQPMRRSSLAVGRRISVSTGASGTVRATLTANEDNSYAIELLYLLKVTSDICGAGM
jgi:hypothetical protein